jgi:hypothetical protein
VSRPRGAAPRTTASEPLRKGFADEPFHDDERPAGVLTKLVDLADVRMIDGGGARLAPEAFDGLRARDGIAHQLDRDGPVEPFVVRFIHDAHPAFAKLTHDPVAADRFHLRCARGLHGLADRRFDRDVDGPANRVRDRAALLGHLRCFVELRAIEPVESFHDRLQV